MVHLAALVMIVELFLAAMMVHSETLVTVVEHFQVKLTAHPASLVTIAESNAVCVDSNRPFDCQNVACV